MSTALPSTFGTLATSLRSLPLASALARLGRHQSLSGRGRSQRLTRDRILRTAIAMADRLDVDAVTMRGLGSELGVEGMALYRHFANKDELLEATVELFVGDITAPPHGALAKRHPRPSNVGAQSVGRAAVGTTNARDAPRTRAGTLSHIEAVMRELRDAGFSHRLQHNTMHVLGARIFDLRACLAAGDRRTRARAYALASRVRR